MKAIVYAQYGQAEIRRVVNIKKLEDFKTKTLDRNPNKQYICIPVSNLAEQSIVESVADIIMSGNYNDIKINNKS